MWSWTAWERAEQDVRYALRAMATQTSGIVDAIGLDVYRDFVCEEAFVDAPRVASFAELATMWAGAS